MFQQYNVNAFFLPFSDVTTTDSEELNTNKNGPAATAAHLRNKMNEAKMRMLNNA